MHITTLGNTSLLELSKTAFFCSRKMSSLGIMRSYDWATEQRDKGQCVVSGFQSDIEKDVLHFLIKGKQPIVIVLARKLYKKIPEEYINPINEGRLLIVSACPNEVRCSIKNAAIRNEYILSICDSVTFGYISPDSSLNTIKEKAAEMGKVIDILS